jgi:indole-3-glycerol phosphate synthase
VSDILDRILAAKRREVEEAKARVPAATIRKRALEAAPPRGFERALRAKIAAGSPR